MMAVGDTDWYSLPPGTPIEGGYYAGLIQQSDGIYALIVAPKSSETTLAWKPLQTNSAGTTSLNDGLSNTNSMVPNQHPAGAYCQDYSEGGFEDWYLPAKDELEICYRNLKPATGANNSTSGENPNSIPPGLNYTNTLPSQTTADYFKEGSDQAYATNYYWTSTQNNETSAWRQTFGNGSQATTLKGSATSLVRPVRRVKID